MHLFRYYCFDVSTGVSVPDGFNLSLTIRDLDTSKNLTVYINLDVIRYPLGLLVGAVVRFDNVERRVSQRGRPYCQFLTASACTVLVFALPPVAEDNVVGAGYV